MPSSAVLAGTDERGRKVYVVMGKVDEASIIGSLTEGESCASLSWDGREVKKSFYEVNIMYFNPVLKAHMRCGVVRCMFHTNRFVISSVQTFRSSQHLLFLIDG